MTSLPYLHLHSHPLSASMPGTFTGWHYTPHPSPSLVFLPYLLNNPASPVSSTYPILHGHYLLFFSFLQPDQCLLLPQDLTPCQSPQGSIFFFISFIYQCYHHLDGQTSPVLFKIFRYIPPWSTILEGKVQIYPIWSRLIYGGSIVLGTSYGWVRAWYRVCYVAGQVISFDPLNHFTIYRGVC